MSAYDDTIKRIPDPNFILGAATIAIVEIRFASFLNGLLSDVPFPNVNGLALEPIQAITILSVYRTCPFTPDPSLLLLQFGF
jgi:hypothetical protein